MKTSPVKVGEPSATADSFEQPTIKGLFVTNHLATLKAWHGEATAAHFAEKYPHLLRFPPFADVPVATEMDILLKINELLHPEMTDLKERHYWTGEYHYRSFKASPLAKLLFSVLPKELKMFLTRGDALARRIFRSLSIAVSEESAHSVLIVIENDPYGIDHWRGFLATWAADFNENVTLSLHTEPKRTLAIRLEWV